MAFIRCPTRVNRSNETYGRISEVDADITEGITWLPLPLADVRRLNLGLLGPLRGVGGVGGQ